MTSVYLINPYIVYHVYARVVSLFGRAGENEDSSSLLGISIMAVAEIAGSILVLYRWRKGITSPMDGAVGRNSEQLQEV